MNDNPALVSQIVNQLEEIAALRAELATLRPAAEALKTAVELKMGILILSDIVSVDYPDDEVSEVLEDDPLAAMIRFIQRAAECIKGEQHE